VIVASHETKYQQLYLWTSHLKNHQFFCSMFVDEIARIVAGATVVVFRIHTWGLQEYNPILTQNRISISGEQGTV
jgi:hypothetical protein